MSQREKYIYTETRHQGTRSTTAFFQFSDVLHFNTGEVLMPWQYCGLVPWKEERVAKSSKKCTKLSKFCQMEMKPRQ